MARDRATVAEREDDDLITVTMVEPQYHADFGRLEPGDEVDMSPKMATRWVGLHLAEADGITFEEAKTHGRVRKIHPYEEPEAAPSSMNPQIAALQQQVADLTRLVQTQLGGEAGEPKESAAQARRAPLKQDKGAVSVPDPVRPEMTTDSKTFGEAAADAKAAEKKD